MNTKDKKYKEFIKLNRRMNSISRELYNLPLIKLDIPYQRGWEINYDLRDDIKSRKDSGIILEALERGYFKSFTNKVEVVRAIRKKEETALIKTTKTGNRAVVDFYPQRNYLTETEYKLSNKLNKFFIFSEFDDYYVRSGRKRYFCSFPRYWLVLKVKPYMITHRRQKGGELEKEYEALRKKLYWSGEFDSFVTNYGKSFPRFKDRSKVKEKCKKLKDGKIEDIFNEKIPREYAY